MGMFDSVFFKCPNCGGEIDEQTKNGPCCLETYNADEEQVPYDIAIGVLGKVKCYSCNSEFEIYADHIPPPPTIKLKIKPFKED